jgi:peptidoglycan/xylan/chitin deacetylase (PgdA/CDA1 family)
MSTQIKTKIQSSSSGILFSRIPKFVSFLSGAFHLASFELDKQISPFERGMLIMSIDVDVGNKELGIINQGKNDSNVSSRMSEYSVGEIEETALPELIELFDKYHKPATFAVRGQLTEVPDSVLSKLLKSTVKHDIGAHGYYHRRFASLSYNEAEAEIRMISNGMQRFGLTPKSFVFPRSGVAYLNLLEEYEYECYREYSDFRHDSMYIKKVGNLWDVHPSFAVDRYTNSVFLKSMLDIAANRRLPMHIWFHIRDFGSRPERSEIKKNLQRVFVQLLDYADRKERNGELTTETMVSAARIARACCHNSSA